MGLMLSRVLMVGVGCMIFMNTWKPQGMTAEWSAEPSIGVKGEYNSNLILSHTPHEEVWGHWASPGVKFAGSTENLEISGRAAADFVRYYGGLERALTNLYFPLSARYRGERDTLSLDGGFTRDNTLMGELFQTGVVLSFTQRNLWNVAPSWTHALTERLSWQAGYQFADATYENGLRLGLVDYRIHGGTGGLSYNLTENSQVQLSGVFTYFEAPQANNLRSMLLGPHLSLTHALSDTFTVNAGAGARFVTNTIDVGGLSLRDQRAVGVFSGMVRKRFEGTTIQLDVSREIFPSGFGLLLQTDRLAFAVQHDITERLSASLIGQVFVADAVSTTGLVGGFPANRFINATPKVSWRLSDWSAVDVSYTYGRRDVEDLGQTGVQHAATVMFTYFPPKLSVGR